MKTRTHFVRIFGATVLPLALIAWATSAHAATISVNTLLDTAGLDGFCTLREAIVAANTDTAVNECPGGSAADTITFSVSGVITLDSTLGQLEIGSNITLDGTGQNVTLSGNGAVRVLLVHTGTTLHLKQLTVANGHVADFPGAIGGGVFNAGTLTVSDTTFSDNGVVSGFIGIGGAIYSIGALSVSNSTFIQNSAPTHGGAISLNAGEPTAVPVTINNSTFSGNISGQGGAIGSNARLLAISNSTFSGNIASAGSAIHTNTELQLTNTILANGVGGSECFGLSGVTASGVNLVEDGSCGFPDALSGDPALGPLAHNGGATMTHALLPGSVAIDPKHNSGCGDFDQRGQPRPADGDGLGKAICDIGAYEYAVPFSFSGFLAPVNSPPIVNAVRAGRGVEVRFGLDGDRGLNIFPAGSPSSQPMNCDAGAVVVDIEQVVAPHSTLSYDPSSDTYTYVWRTERTWAGTCRQFVLRLADGTYHTATFLFR